MTFVPRNYEQILNDMVSHVRANTTITDFTIGSVIRTILEAASLEDDEQYYQMVQLLDAFRIATSSGADLDERAADYNLTRLAASSASGEVTIQNGGLTIDELLYDAAIGVTSLYLADSSNFPAAPFNIRVGESTAQVEDCTVSFNNTTTNILTVGALTNAHDAGERVAETGGGDKSISAGIQVQVPAKGGNQAISFTTIIKTTIADGNYESSSVTITASTTGLKGNVSAGQISKFQSSSPFTGATVSNKKSTSGGRDLETDEELRARLIRRLQELTRGTSYAIESAVIGITDSTTGQSVVTAKLREDFSDPYNNILYVDDGTGFTPSRTVMARTSLNGAHLAGVTSINVYDVTEFPDSGYILIDPTGTTVELVQYTSVGSGNIINLAATTVNGHASDQEVLFVEYVADAEEGQNFFRLSNWPILDNSLELFDNDSGTFNKKVKDTDYLINRTNGEVQYLGIGLLQGTTVVAHSSYYTGLLYLVQKILNGDPEDRTNFPGVVAGGIIVHVSVPTVRRITVYMTITAKNGYDEIQLKDEVKTAVESYLGGLLIGNNIYRSKIIEKASRITGVENIILTAPASDIIILENEIPTPYDINGDSLVQVN